MDNPTTHTSNGLPLFVVHKETDPISVRISMGGGEKWGGGYYLTYRGDFDEVKEVIKQIGDAIKDLSDQPLMFDVSGKKYA